MVLWLMPRLDPLHLRHQVPQRYQVDWLDHYSSHIHQPMGLLVHRYPLIHLGHLDQHHLRLQLHLLLHPHLENQEVRNCHRYGHHRPYHHHRHSHHYLLLG